MTGFIELSALLDVRAFEGPTPEARERSARRFCESLPLGQAEKVAGRWTVSPEARLPDGSTVRARLMIGTEPDRRAGLRLPPGHAGWNEAARQRFLDTHELLNNWDLAKRASRGHSDESIIRTFVTNWKEWAAQRGLKCSLTCLRRYRRRLNPNSGPGFDGNVDSRGRKALGEAGRDQTIPPELWQFFCGLYLQTNQLPVAEAYRITAAHAVRERLACPSLRTFQIWAAQIPKPVRVLARLGQHKFEADCIPKIQRDYESIPAGELWCGDETPADYFCRVPDARKGWRLIRPKLTLWQDMRSRMIVGWHLGERANTDTILAALKMAANSWGFPQECTIDNGKDYRSVGGKNRRKWADFDEARLGSVFAQAGVTVHYAIPYHASSKTIESAGCKATKNFDRLQKFYAGNSPSTKPADLNERLKDILSVPTLDDVRTRFEEWLLVYHATPQTGDGMFGLTPALVMERYRGQVRKCSPEALELLCAKMVGPRTVGRDGIRHCGILYGRFNEDLYALQGRKVWLRINPESVAFIDVCDENGVPICRAENSQMRCATPDDLRSAHQHKGHLRKITRKAMQGREFLLDTTPGQIMGLKREAAEAAQAALRKSLPTAPASPSEVTLIRPDLHAAAARLGKASPFARLAENVAVPDNASEPRRVNAREFFTKAFDEVQAEPAQEAGFDWAAYYERNRGTERDTDAPASGFAALADGHGTAAAAG